MSVSTTTPNPQAIAAPDPGEAERRKLFWLSFIGVLLIVLLYWFPPPVSFAYDPHDERCLPDVHLSLMTHWRPTEIADGDLVFWEPKKTPALSYVKQAFVLKMVAGVAGDRLQIHGGHVTVNGRDVAQGLALAGLYDKTPSQFDRDETIPAGKLFVIGTHPHSDDSRYWGYLNASDVAGKAYKLY